MRKAAVVLLVLAAALAAVWLFLHGGDPGSGGGSAEAVGPSTVAPPAAAEEATGSPAASLRGRAERPTAHETTSSSSVTGYVRRASDGTHVAEATVRWFGLDAASLIHPDYDEPSVRVAAGEGAREPDPSATTTTDAEGAFALDIPADVRWEVVATAEGFAPASKLGRGPGRAVLKLEVPSAVRFVVLDGATRVPVAGALLRVYPDGGSSVPRATVRSGADGRADVPLVLGDWVLVTAPGFAPEIRPCPVLGAFGDAPYEIELRPAAALAGEVVDAEGGPVRGARVSTDALPEQIRERTVLGDDGRFRLTVPAGDAVHTLWAEAEGFGPATVRARGGDEAVRIVLDAAAWVEGTVVDARGRALDEIQVLRGVHLGGGAFRVGPLEPGVHDVTVESERDGATHQGHALVAVRAGERRTGIRIVVPDSAPSSEVEVRVLDPEGGPAEDVHVHCVNESLFSSGGDPIDRDSFLMLLEAPAGTSVRIHAQPQDPRRDWVAPPAIEAKTSRIGESEPVVVRLLAARVVVVRVLDPQGSELNAEDCRTFVAGGHGARVTENGLLVADGARFRIRVGSDGHAEHETDASSADVVDGVLTVRLPRGATVRGRVVLGEGIPGSAVRVVASVTPAGADSVSASVTPSDDGTFSLEGLPDGRGSVSVHPLHVDDTRLRRIPLLVAGANVELGVVRIGPFVRITGQVVDERDLPVGHAHVLVTSADGFRVEYQCRENGSFDVRVPSGAPVAVFAARQSNFSPLFEVTPSADAAPLRLRVERAVDVLVTSPLAHEDDLGVAFGRPGRGAVVPLERIWRSGPPPRFSVRVPPGTWDLRFTLHGREWTRTITFGRGDVGEVTFGE